MRPRSVLVLVFATAAVFVQACDRSTAPVPPPGSTAQCVGTLSMDSVVTRTLDSANACRSRDLLSGDSTLAHSFVLRVEAGRGYLVTMQSKAALLHGRLELIGGDNAGATLLAASRNDVDRAQLLFASATAATDTIRATTADALPSDTGSYDISVRACRVPVPLVTDSVTHSDTNVAGDCLVDLSSFLPADLDVAYVQLYAVRSTDGFKVRPISFTSSIPMRVFIGGPHLDTFGVGAGSQLAYLDSAMLSASFYFSGRPGDYTLVMASPVSAGAPLSYTLTIGTERTLSSAQRTRVGASTRAPGVGDP